MEMKEESYRHYISTSALGLLFGLSHLVEAESVPVTQLHQVVLWYQVSLGT